MKKIFYWETFIKNMGKRNFAGLIIAIVITVIGIILVFNEFGYKLVIESFAFSYLFEQLKELKNAIKKTQEEYTITKK